MLNKFYFYEAPSLNPFETLALEEVMMENIKDDEIVLYLYTHADTVVIGKNQNAWAECRHEKLFADGGKLARRPSGGGAVFHDIGNLNFSFVVSQKNYDLHRQLKVILEAVKSFGIDAEFSGRNDIVTSDGRKFSGNAFCFKKSGAFHHGTILIGADMTKLSKYLSVSKDKIESKGIKSVRSRVVNLDELSKNVTPEAMAVALKKSFEEEYGKTQPYPVTEKIQAEVDKYVLRNSSFEWLFGKSPQFDISIKNRFSFGEIEFLLKVDDGEISDALVYSDAMDVEFIEKLASRLTGIRFSSGSIIAAFKKGIYTDTQKEMLDELAEYIKERDY